MARNGRERAFACDTSSLICAGRFDTRRRAKPDLILPDPMIAMVMSELLCGAQLVGGWVSGLSGTIFRVSNSDWTGQGIPSRPSLLVGPRRH